MSDPTKRFSSRVADYVKYRPSYPAAAIDFLMKSCGLDSGSSIADVGCGTGISTKLLLDRGCTVYGVEPNVDMLDAARENLSGYERFIPVNAASEATTLEDNSVNAVTAFQAFHWFDHAAVGAEFRRIVKPGGSAAVVWNERKLDATPFLVEYESLLKSNAVDYDVVRHDRIDRQMIADAVSGKISAAEFENSQEFDLEGLLGRAASSSYMPGRDHPNFGKMRDGIERLFAKHNESGRITVFYKTTVTCIKL